MISVIIPAYNAAPFLRRAVESVVKGGQDFNAFEVIIVQNGSKDNTTEVAEELTKEYSNVTLYHSSKGVSNARNMGIEMAKGEWIAFLDADDSLTELGRQTMIRDSKSSEDNISLYAYGHEVANNPHPVCEKTQKYGKNQLEEIRAEMISNPTKYMQAWAKLFRRSIIAAHDLRFDPTMRLAEDSDFTLRYTKYCNSITISEVIAYHYSIDNVSTMRGVSRMDKVLQFVEAMEKTAKAVQNESETIKRAYNKYALMNLNIAMVRDVYNVESTLTKAEKTNKLKETIQNPIFQKAINETEISECMSPRMVPVLAMKKGFFGLAGLVYTIRAKQNYKRENS